MSGATPIITFENVNKRFGRMVAVDNVSLTINEGEFFSLLGPSGCGKTTLLRMLAGFETPTEGRILIDGQDISAVPPNKRPVNMVFQSYAVFPHMSVADNIAYGLKVDRVPAAERAKRVEEALDLVQLGGLGEDETFHPSPQVRIERIFGDHPGIRETIGCGPSPNRAKYCGFEWSPN